MHSHGILILAKPFKFKSQLVQNKIQVKYRSTSTCQVGSKRRVSEVPSAILTEGNFLCWFFCYSQRTYLITTLLTFEETVPIECGLWDFMCFIPSIRVFDPPLLSRLWIKYRTLKFIPYYFIDFFSITFNPKISEYYDISVTLNKSISSNFSLNVTDCLN